MSEAGSPWAIEPPIVPRLRTCWSAMVSATIAASPMSGWLATAWWVVMAPIRNAPFSRSIPDRPGTRRRSTSSDGAASRSFISGSSEWPPASTLASSPPSRSAPSAASRESGTT